MIKLEPYLNFEGNCMEAFEFYKSVFGGEFTGITRYKDAPNMNFGDQDKERLMHIALPVGDTLLMGGDAPSTMKLEKGNNLHLTLAPDTEREARRLFDALSAGGSQVMPLAKTFWAELFGMCTDKFGVNWIVNYGWSE